MITSAYIHLWNKRVGAVAWLPDKRLGAFEFMPTFAELGWEVSPLRMPVAGSRGKVFSFPETRDTSTFKGLPGLLADVLPDKYGSALINAWLAKNGRPADSLNPVELLCFIGKRGMGALEFEPVSPGVAPGSATHIEIDSLVHVAREILSGREQFLTHLNKDEEKAVMDMFRIGTSAGGARAKALIAFNPLTREVRSGQTQAPSGFSHWLLKFDGVMDAQSGTTQGYGRVEMAYHLMAADAGIRMMECRLLEENGRAHFMTRRFDRHPEHGKLHVQTFCALTHFDFNDITTYSYEQLFELMRRLRLPYTDAEQLFRRMVFNVVARNCDDHTKNFAFAMDRTGRWYLAPAYDVCYAYRPGSMWVSCQSLSVNGKREDITRDDLLEVARNMHIKKAASIIDRVEEVVSNWNSYADKTGVSSELKVLIWKNVGLL